MKLPLEGDPPMLTIEGRPWWLLPSGDLLPVISGGAGEPDDGEPKDPEPGPEEEPFDAERAKAKIAKANSEAANLRKRVKDLEAKAKRLDELEDSQKSEIEKANERVTTAEKAAQEATLRADRLQVAHEKGLTPAQAKRLVGATREELEADADEIIEAFPAKDAPKPPPSQRPRADLRPTGSDPTEDPDVIDPAKLAESIPRP
jgi:hypothetical protein